jgi:hypothetical protein
MVNGLRFSARLGMARMPTPPLDVAVNRSPITAHGTANRKRITYFVVSKHACPRLDPQLL